jgi:hypothetical protein
MHVDADGCREFASRGQAFAAREATVDDRRADASGELFVERERVARVDADEHPENVLC